MNHESQGGQHVHPTRVLPLGLMVLVLGYVLWRGLPIPPVP